MISVKEAQQKILKNVKLLSFEQVKLTYAFKRVLAADIVSPISHPQFKQSAVDGYAVRYRDLKSNKGEKKSFKIIGESKAGIFRKFIIKQNEAVRIFTGAPVPAECDTVIMQEDIIEINDYNIIVKVLPSFCANVRNKGEQIKKGNIALKKGSYLDSASLGFLASLGINKVKVYNLPRVSIIVTGNEFVKSRRKLSKGKIYESNGLMLKSLLKDMNIHSQSRLCKDDLTGLTLLIKKEIDKNDIIIISGGVSVGDYDFTEKALKKLKFNIIFYKVYQKPGKPLLFAKRKNKTVFGLPGNPRSALMCFYEYVYPYILASMGNKKPLLLSAALPLVHNYIKNEEKTLFMTSKLTDKGINILEGQDSHMLKSFSEADTIVCLTEGKKNYTAGELVTVHFLPG